MQSALVVSLWSQRSLFSLVFVSHVSPSSIRLAQVGMAILQEAPCLAVISGERAWPLPRAAHAGSKGGTQAFGLPVSTRVAPGAGCVPRNRSHAGGPSRVAARAGRAPGVSVEQERPAWLRWAELGAQEGARSGKERAVGCWIM